MPVRADRLNPKAANIQKIRAEFGIQASDRRPYICVQDFDGSVRASLPIDDDITAQELVNTFQEKHLQNFPGNQSVLFVTFMGFSSTELHEGPLLVHYKPQDLLDEIRRQAQHRFSL